jgi:hypothetical protein
MSMISTQQIKPNAPVLCCNDGQFGIVDHVEGASIKLKKDDSGQHHFIPLSWVTKVDDDAVHVDRPGDQAMREWSSFGP